MHVCTLYTFAMPGTEASSVALRPPPYAFLNLFDTQALRYR